MTNYTVSYSEFISESQNFKHEILKQVQHDENFDLNNLELYSFKFICDLKIVICNFKFPIFKYG